MVRMNFIFIGLIHFLLISMFSSVQAKELYVSTSMGDDNVTYYKNSIDLPWKTLVHSIYNLKAGDTLYIREGIYKPSYVLWTKNDYTSKTKGGDPSEDMNAESGSELAPIIITGYPDETPIIDLAHTRTFVELDNKSYWTFKNLKIINAGKAFQLGEDAVTEHITFDSLVIFAEIGGDNSGNITLQGGADHIVIINCVLRGPGTSSDIHLNTTALYATRTQNLLVSNNELSNAPIGLYFKHANDPYSKSDIRIQNNYISDTSRNAMQLNSNGAFITNNIFGANNSPILVNEANGVPGGDYNTFRQNTILTKLILQEQTQSGDNLPGAIGNTIINNIFADGIVSLHRYSSLPHLTVSDYNMYSSSPIIIQNRIEYDLNDWQKSGGGDTHSTMGTPIFIGGTLPSTPSGFVLDSVSLGVGLGDDGKNLGANATSVGSTLSAKYPKEPTGLGAQ